MDLFKAAEVGDVSAVKRLLDSGVSVNSEDKSSMTALNWACEKNQFEVAQVLLERGASVELGNVISV